MSVQRTIPKYVWNHGDIDFKSTTLIVYHNINTQWLFYIIPVAPHYEGTEIQPATSIQRQRMYNISKKNLRHLVQKTHDSENLMSSL